MAAAFEDLGVMPEIIEGLEEMGWTLPTAVQAEAIPLALGGGDLLVAAETGAGKTGAFCLPIVQIVYESLRSITAAEQAGDIADERVVMSTWDHDSGLLVEEGSNCSSQNPNNWQGGRATHGASKGTFTMD